MAASRKRERAELVAHLRGEGKTWVEVADVLRERYGVNARVALRLAHGWSQGQAAAEWNKRWPDDLKSGKNWSYWETWPVSGYPPSLGTLDRLAQLYECSVANLLEDISDYRHLDVKRAGASTAEAQLGGQRPASGISHSTSMKS